MMGAHVGDRQEVLRNAAIKRVQVRTDHALKRDIEGKSGPSLSDLGWAITTVTASPTGWRNRKPIWMGGCSTKPTSSSPPWRETSR